MIHDERFDLHLPADAAAAAAVVLHPHPGMGGDRHHPVVVALAERLAGIGMAALRVDIGDPDPAAAVADLVAAADLACEHAASDRLVLVGYSWGSIVVALAGRDDVAASLGARVLVAPPVSMQPLDESPAAADGTPALVLVPEHDQFGPPDAVRVALAGWRHATVEEVAGADHFLAGHAATVADRAATWLEGLPDLARQG